MTNSLVVFFTLTLMLGLGLLGLVGYRLAVNWGTPPPAEPVSPPLRAPPTPSATPLPGATPSPQPTVSASATPSPTAESCREWLLDGGFESGEGWTIVSTAYSAGYVTTPAEYVTNPVRSGQRALRVGIAEGANLFSYSSIDQTVTIPAEATSARLSCWVYQASGARDDDLQYLLALKEDGGYDVLMWERTDARAWQQREFALDAYRGQRIALRFGVHNDGRQDLTTMYVDDVSLAVCFGATPTP